MKDIDFDELDKAVNSLMATAPVTPAPADDQKPDTTLDVPSSDVAPAPAPASEQGESVAVVSTKTVGAVTADAQPAAPAASVAAPVAPAIKRSGRFMDMVHTSSDMKPRTGIAAPSREGISISPRPQSEAPAPAQPPAAMSELVRTTPDVMPDPLDLGNAVPSIDEPTPEVPEPSPLPDMETTVPAATAESPFIADAKVEKRPLNPAASASEESFDAQLANELADEPTDQTEPEPPAETDAAADEPPVIPQVPELSSDLVAIESNDKLDAPVATQGVDTEDAASAVDAPAKPLGATSIAQQYRTQPSTGDQSHAAIYDASQYPEPVAHPAKKKSGWLWVLWVILLLGVGAGAAVGLYFMGIIP